MAEEKCIDIKKYLDTEIKKITLDDLLKPNDIFAEAPIIYGGVLVSSINDNKTNVQTATFDRDLIKIDEKIYQTKTLFDEKKIFADVITSEMSSNLLFSDDRQLLISNFQYLVNTMFNTKINEYVKKYHPKLVSEHENNNLICFMYKGSNAMKMIFEKHRDLFPNHTKLFEDMSGYFTRSDADYGIYINRNIFNIFENYNQVLLDMNKLVYNTLSQIQLILSANLTNMCPLNNIITNDLQLLLIKLNGILYTNKSEMKYFENVNRFIGISINNKDYFEEKYKGQLDKATIHTFKEDQQNVDDVKEDQQNVDDVKEDKSEKDMQFIKDKKVSTDRKNFIIKIHEKKDEKKDEKKYVPGIIIPAQKVNENGIYYSMNETNRYKNRGKLAEFVLHRLKISVIIYYITNNNKYGYFNAPSELIDVGIAFFNDVRIQNITNLTDIIKEYKYEENRNFMSSLYNSYVRPLFTSIIPFTFYSYSLRGFIEDLYKGLFEESDYPWQAGKYKKKIHRLIVLLIIYIALMLKETPTQLLEMYNLLYNFIYVLNYASAIDDNSNNIDNVENNIYIRAKNIKDPLLKQFINYIINLKIKTILPELYGDAYTNFMSFGIDILRILQEMTYKINKDIQPLSLQTVNALQKYIKYKNKYINLLKKINNINLVTI